MSAVRATALLATTLFALTSCSAASTVVVTAPPAATTASPTASASPTTATPTPTPSPTVMAKAQAADWYLSAICPSNAASEAADDTFSGLYADDLDKAKVRRLTTRAAAANRTAAARLDAPPLPWPADVRAAVAKVTAQVLAEVTYYQDIARAKTAEDMITASNSQVGASGANVPAQTARLRLGLPTAGAAKDGCAKWFAANR